MQASAAKHLDPGGDCNHLWRGLDRSRRRQRQRQDASIDLSATLSRLRERLEGWMTPVFGATVAASGILAISSMRCRGRGPISEERFPM
jgi:hypothetical protein